MLEFLHPHMTVKINDNSFVNEEATGGGTALFAPFISDKGRDRVIELQQSVNALINNHGVPNFKLHGQMYYNIIRWIQGGGRAYTMRLTADDATYANAVLVVKTRAAQVPLWEKDANGEYDLDVNGNRKPKVDADGKQITGNGVEIKLEVEYLDNVVDKSTLNDLLANGISGDTPDADGFFSHPLYLFTVRGRGKYGNNYSIRLSLNTKMDDGTYDFRMYDTSILESDSNGNLSVRESYTASTFPEALSLGNTSLSIDSVFENYSEEVEVIFSEEAYDRLLERIVAGTVDAVTGETVIQNPQNIDFLFATDTKGTAYDYLMISPDSIAVSKLDGFRLGSGSDGAFDKSQPAAIRRQAINKAYVNAFTGVTNTDVFNELEFPFDVVLDANLDLTVKRSILTFVSERTDVWAGLDTGILASAKAAVAWRKNEMQDDTYMASIFGQSQIIFDDYTAKNIPVTSTYFLANKIPSNDAQFGRQYPFVGPRRGILTGFRTLDWNPNKYEKEELYKARVNYIESDYDSTRFMSNLTMQYRTSSLSSINNVRTLLQMVRRVKNLSKQYFFEFASAATLSDYNANLNTILSEYVENGACSYATGAMTQTAYEAEMKTAKVTISLAFNNVIERINIEFNVGK